MRKVLASGGGVSWSLARGIEVVELVGGLGGLGLDILGNGTCRNVRITNS